jgi:hypothetical protein
MIGIAIIYVAGYLLSLWMMRVEQASEKEVYTKGDRALSVAMSFLSWAMVLIMVVTAWTSKISLSGYWNKPVKENEHSKESQK